MKKDVIKVPYEFNKELLKNCKGLEEDIGSVSPKYIIKLKKADNVGRKYHPAFFVGTCWHSYRGENFFHEEIEAYWEVTPEKANQDIYKRIGTSSHVPCWFYDECKQQMKTCRCCWCDGKLKNGEILKWNSTTKSYDYVLPQEAV